MLFISKINFVIKENQLKYWIFNINELLYLIHKKIPPQILHINSKDKQ